MSMSKCNLQISYCLSNLILTGAATPYCHNGALISDYEVGLIIILVKSPDLFQSGKERKGIVNRNEFGFFFWNSDNKKMESINLGSRYKTPILPIWLTCIQDSWGVLFNPNKDLMKSYAAENRFSIISL